MNDIRKNARERMKGVCRVCPVCDGRACAGEVPGMGGLNTAASFKNNISALRGVRLAMRCIHGVKEPDTATTWLGIPLALPLVAAPLGGMFNFGGAVEDQEYVDAILQGCDSRGVIGCTGDGVPPVIFDSGLAGIEKVAGRGVPFVKPWDGDEMNEKTDRALAGSAMVMGSDLDAAGLVTLRLMGRPVSPKTVPELRAWADRIHAAGKKFVVKGVMSVKDALAAVEAGIDGIVVSNHGGRVLDHTPGTAEVLPAIAGAVKGKIAIMVDSGVRDGFDILKMLALGADAVSIGRPFAIAAIGGGAAGVAAYVDQCKAELVQAMVLTGCPDIASVSAAVLA